MVWRQAFDPQRIAMSANHAARTPGWAVLPSAAVLKTISCSEALLFG